MRKTVTYAVVSAALLLGFASRYQEAESSLDQLGGIYQHAADLEAQTRAMSFKQR